MATAPDSYEGYSQMSNEYIDGQQTEPAQKAVTGSREAKTLANAAAAQGEADKGA